MDNTKMWLHQLIEEGKLLSINVDTVKIPGSDPEMHLNIVLTPQEEKEPEDEYQTL